MHTFNKRGDLELRTIVVLIILFFTMLIVITWVSGGFKKLTGGVSKIGDTSMNKACDTSCNRYSADGKTDFCTTKCEDIACSTEQTKVKACLTNCKGIKTGDEPCK